MGSAIEIGASASVTAPLLRVEMLLDYVSTTSLKVTPGSIDVGGTVTNTTADTTLTLTTAGDWIGGSSLQATNTTGFVYIDSAGNIKLHTTAPSHSDYAVSSTVGTRRFVQISGTVYRCLGWFRMNGTGSGQLDVYHIANVPEFGVRNKVRREYGAVQSLTINFSANLDDTVPQSSELTEWMRVGFVAFNADHQVKITVHADISGNTSGMGHVVGLFKDTIGANAFYASFANRQDGSASYDGTAQVLNRRPAGSVGTYEEYHANFGGTTGGNTSYLNGDGSGTRYFSGRLISFIEVEEILDQQD